MKFFLWLLLLLPALVFGDIRYELKPEIPNQAVHLQIHVNHKGGDIEFRIPAWCPGYYKILQYQDKIYDVRLVDTKGAEIELTRPDPRGWRATDAPKGALTLSYRVLGDDAGLGFFGVNVRPRTAFVNGPAAFMYVEGRLNEATRLKITLPDGWDIATAMTPDAGVWGEFSARDYDELIDHPIEMGHFERYVFSLRGTLFEAIYVSSDGTYAPDLNQQTQELRMVSEAVASMFPGPFPFKRYAYLVHLAVGGFGGGLEHQSSTVLATSNSPRMNVQALAAHEFFHVWNVKHIRPEVLGPFDYTKPNRTRNLWFAEGVTEYYAQLLLARAGIRTREMLLSALSHSMHSVERSKTAREMTIEDVSYQAWDHWAMGVGDLSFYDKGLALGLLFDAAIIDATNGKKSLDDVIRLLMSRHALPKKGYPEDGVLKAINEVAGKDLSKLYRQAVQSTDPIPYEAVLPKVGLKFDQRRVLIEDPAATERATTLREYFFTRAR